MAVQKKVDEGVYVIVYEILQVNFKNAERRRDNESIVLQINPKQ
jgi:hypothetical protein